MSKNQKAASLKPSRGRNTGLPLPPSLPSESQNPRKTPTSLSAVKMVSASVSAVLACLHVVAQMAIDGSELDARVVCVPLGIRKCMSPCIRTAATVTQSSIKSSKFRVRGILGQYLAKVLMLCSTCSTCLVWILQYGLAC